MEELLLQLQARNLTFAGNIVFYSVQHLWRCKNTRHFNRYILFVYCSVITAVSFNTPYMQKNVNMSINNTI